MRAISLPSLYLFIMMGASVGTPHEARAQNGAVLLPPAPIPNASSRRTSPRSVFAAPNPVPRPAITDQADSVALPYAPASPEASSASVQTPAALDLTNPARPITDLPRSAPPNPTPRSSLVLTRTVDRDDRASDDFADTIAAEAQETERTDEVLPDPLCHQALGAAGAIFEIRGRVEGEGQCGIDDAVALQSIGGITLQPAALIACPTATVFTAFVQETIAPSAERIMGADPTTLYIAASYVCRGRNNVEGARISEHGFGRAVDLRAVDLSDGQTWSVQPYPAKSEDPDARFLTVLREEACGPFNTVLGPGSDGHHTDHVHFDTAPRSSTYCR